MVVTKNVPVVAVLCGMAIRGLYAGDVEGHAFTHADNDFQTEDAFTRDVGFASHRDESERRKGEPSAERERLRRGWFGARANACPSGSFPNRSTCSPGGRKVVRVANTGISRRAKTG